MATQLGSMEIYNVKIIEYANGQVEIRKYSEPIGLEKMACVDMSSEQFARRIELGKKFSEVRRQGELQYNPFTDEVERLKTFEQLELDKERERKNLQDSLNRSKNAVYQLARQCRWKYFITLTFAPEKVDRSDYCACMKKANEWFHNQKKRYAKDLRYLFVGELHSDKVNWHIHGLLDDVGDMKFVDSGKKDKAGRPIYNVGSWSCGWSTAIAIEQTDESIFKISSYITQYITKDLCSRTRGQKRYFRSQNIPKPLEHTALIPKGEIDNYIEIIVDSLGLNLEYEKDLSGYLDVGYRYYKKEREEKEDERKIS